MQSVDLIAVDGGPRGDKATGIVRLSRAIMTAGMLPGLLLSLLHSLFEDG